ncbi:FixH family protein [Phenylobacterium sp.]|uniref:FixH family protein n=1 Tax=Phenylobacterium sp. TaxID=1871053 RepID=UPI0035B002D0
MTDTPSGFRLRGWHVLVILVAFFGVVSAVNAVMITAAIGTFPGQVSVTPYEDGIVYNKTLAQMASQERLGWRAAASVEEGAVMIRVVDRLGQPVEGLRLNCKLERPATETGRLTPAFKEVSPGVYRAHPGVTAGAWDLSFDATDAAGHRFEGQRRLMWP